MVRPLLGLVTAAALIALPLAWWLAQEPLEPLDRLYPMPAFSLTDQEGAAFGAEQVKGKVVVANFVFTNCPTVCPMLTTHMAKLQERLARFPDVHHLSFSVDPRNDTPEVLKAYGASFRQDPSRWTFLTGEFSAIATAVEKGFKIHMAGGDVENATAFDIVHGEYFVLVDRDGVIRGYYQPNEERLANLVRDVERLLDEPRS